jgi:hypothetical protein
MGSIRLRISVKDIEAVRQSYSVLRVKRSITGETGVYEYVSDVVPRAATILAGTVGTYDVVGKTLQFIRDSHPQVDVLFTGTSHLTPAQVVSQINVAAGVVVAAVDANKVRLTSTITGTESKLLIVGGSAAVVFGWVAGTKVIGKEPHIALQAGVSLYEFVDDDGEAGYFYKSNYYNASTALSSNDSSPFLGATATMVGTDKLSIATIDLVDGAGIAIPEQEVTFYSVHEPLQVEGFQVALSRKPISVKTDNAGHAEVTLVRGLKVRVVFEGTGLIREIVVPNQASFDLLQLISTAADPYAVKTLDLPFAIRRTI